MPRGKTAAFTISGLEEAIATLKSFDRKVRERVMKGAFQAALKPTLKEAKKNAKKAEDSGALETSLCIVAKTDKRNGRTVSRVGVDKNLSLVETVESPAGVSERVVRRPVKYAHIFEFGSRSHTIKEGKNSLFGPITVRHPGTKPHPFLRAAWDATERKALDRLFAELEKRIAKVMRTLR